MDNTMFSIQVAAAPVIRSNQPDRPTRWIGFIAALLIAAGSFGAFAGGASAQTATTSLAGRHCEAVSTKLMICTVRSSGKSVAVPKGRSVNLRPGSFWCPGYVPCPYKLPTQVRFSPRWSNQAFGNVLVMKRAGITARASGAFPTPGEFWELLKADTKRNIAFFERLIDRVKICIQGDASKAGNIETFAQSLPFANCGFNNDPVTLPQFIQDLGW